MHTFGASCHACKDSTGFISEKQLKQHIADQHGQCKQKGGWVCNFCDKKLGKFSNYVRHMATHCPNNYKAYHCSQCKYSASTKADVNCHTKQRHSLRETSNNAKTQQVTTKTPKSGKSTRRNNKSKSNNGKLIKHNITKSQPNSTQLISHSKSTASKRGVKRARPTTKPKRGDAPRSRPNIPKLVATHPQRAPLIVSQSYTMNKYLLNGIPSIPSNSYLTRNFIEPLSSNDSTNNTDNNNANQTESSNISANNNGCNNINGEEAIANLPRVTVCTNSSNNNAIVETVTKLENNNNTSMEQGKQQSQLSHIDPIETVTNQTLHAIASSRRMQLQVKRRKRVEVDYNRDALAAISNTQRRQAPFVDETDNCQSVIDKRLASNSNNTDRKTYASSNAHKNDYNYDNTDSNKYSCDENQDIDVLSGEKNNRNKTGPNSDVVGHFKSTSGNNETIDLSSKKNMISNSSDNNTKDNHLKQLSTILDYLNDTNRPITIIVCYNMCFYLFLFYPK